MEKVIQLINDTHEYDQKLRLNNEVSLEILNSFCDTMSVIIKDIVERIGLPSPDKVGEEASKNFLNLLDHMSDNTYLCTVFDEHKFIDLGFYKPGVALLIDKILHISEKKQRFGTALKAYTDTDGQIKSRPIPIEDEANVEKRREEFGLEPLDKYIEKANEIFKKINRKDNTV